MGGPRGAGQTLLLSLSGRFGKIKMVRVHKAECQKREERGEERGDIDPK